MQNFALFQKLCSNSDLPKVEMIPPPLLDVKNWFFKETEIDGESKSVSDHEGVTAIIKCASNIGRFSNRNEIQKDFKNMC